MWGPRLPLPLASSPETDVDEVRLAVVEGDSHSPVAAGLRLVGLPVVLVLRAVPAVGPTDGLSRRVGRLVDRGRGGAALDRVEPLRSAGGLNDLTCGVLELE